MKSCSYGTGWWARAAMVVLAVLAASAIALAQSDSEPNDGAATTATQSFFLLQNRGGGEGSFGFFSRAVGGQRMVFLGGGAAEPVVVNMEGPGYLITCGQPSGGAAIAYEFVAAEPRTSDGPDPRSEAAVRRLSEEFARGEPSYDLMTPCMAGTARTQLERLQEQFSSLGPIEAVTFDADWSAHGADTFDVEYADGSLRWVIALTPDGKAKMWMFYEVR